MEGFARRAYFGAYFQSDFLFPKSQDAVGRRSGLLEEDAELRERELGIITADLIKLAFPKMYAPYIYFQDAYSLPLENKIFYCCIYIYI